MKQKLSKLLSLGLIFTLIFSNLPTTKVLANQEEVQVSLDASAHTLSIGNRFLRRDFSFTENRLKTTNIQNLLGQSNFVPQDTSEEFVIKGLASAGARQTPPDTLQSVKPAPQNATQIEGSPMTNDASENASIYNMFDTDRTTYWASREQTAGTAHMILNFGQEVQVKKIKYEPRYHNSVHYNTTGRMKKYRIEYWNAQGQWEQAKEANFTQNQQNQKPEDIVLDQSVQTSKIKITALESYFYDNTKVNKFLSIGTLDVLNEAEQSVIVKPDVERTWRIEGTSLATNEGNGYPALIDGNPATYYHSRYSDGTGTSNRLPVKLTLDRGSEAAQNPFQTFGYRPRNIQNNNGSFANGTFQKAKIYVSDDKQALYNEANLKKTAVFDYQGVVVANAAAANFVYVSLPEQQTGRYVGIEVVEASGRNFASGVEIDLFNGVFDSNIYREAKEVKTSEMTLSQTPEVTETTATINGQQKTGKMITFTFAPVTYGQGTLEVKQKVVMYNGDHFMRKFLEIKASDREARFEYIDGEHLKTQESDTKWTIPTNKGGVVQMTAEKANLGQPIYINGLFLGSEFPATDTQIVQNLGRMRYYTGKNFTDFARDGQLTEDGKYVTWQTVLGASASNGSDMQVVQSDFYRYINSIATPSDFRIQYNSWFDNMMFITDENILSSFSAVDKHFSKTGVRPLDSYVVDDGWNIYRPNSSSLRGGDDIRRNGANDVNTAGFWQFNSKFPQELTPSSELVQNFGSNFGVWIGPRGGYNYQSQLAGIITRAGKGSTAGHSIDVADTRYIRHYEEMVLDWMTRFNVNYWKWDGFADNAQYNAFPSGANVVGYSESNQHMYGGVNGFYHSTDLWEKWIGLMKNVRTHAARLNIPKLWISLTCYVNPSPWFLQWANSVWLQCVGDRGERRTTNTLLNNMMDMMMTYRDGSYYDFVKEHQFQFPLANIYNHDPIYGKEGTGIRANSMNGAQFRNYMFMQGTRGTAFWELYYSDELFNNEKYLINADFLEWAEANFAQLRNAKMIGGNPDTESKLTSSPIRNAGTQEAYGFAGFAGGKGIVSVRNPAPVEKQIQFTLNESIGVTEDGTYYVVPVSVYTHPGHTPATPAESYNKGDQVTLNLKPGETQVLSLSKERDQVAPVLDRLYFQDAHNVQVRASEHVKNVRLQVKVNGGLLQENEYTVTKLEDLRSFDINILAGLTSGAVVEVVAAEGSDESGNTLSQSKLSRIYYEKSVVASVPFVVEDGQMLAPQAKSLDTLDGFTVSATVKNSVADTVLVQQGNAYKLGIDTENRPYFEVNGVRVTAKQTLLNGFNQIITGVKENNGLLKIYMDGQINRAKYNASVRDFVLPQADIVMNKKTAEVKDVTVYNRSLSYDEVPQLQLADLIRRLEESRDRYTDESYAAEQIASLLQAGKQALANQSEQRYTLREEAYNNLYAAYLRLIPKRVKNLVLRKPVSAKFTDETTDGVLPSSDRPIAYVVDGNNPERNGVNSAYTVVGSVNARKASYIEINLGDVARIDSAKLTRYWLDGRTYSDTAFVVAKNADFSDKKVLYYSAQSVGTDRLQLGQNATESLYAESAAGKVLYARQENGEVVEAQYIRLYGRGRENNANNSENHLIELTVMGEMLKDDPYNLNTLKALIALAEAEKVKDKFSEETRTALAEEIERAKQVVSEVERDVQTDKSVGYVENRQNALQEKLAALVLRKADYTAVEAAIAKYRAKLSEKDKYTNFEAVERAVESIVEDLAITEQARVAEMAEAIENALSALELKDSERPVNELYNSNNNHIGISVQGNYTNKIALHAEDVSAEHRQDTLFKEKEFKVYDIYLKNKETNEVVNPPNSEHTVKIPVEKEVEGLYYLPENGQAPIKLNFTYDAASKMLTFTTSHFSKYAIIYAKEKSTGIASIVLPNIVSYLQQKPQKDEKGVKDIVPNTSAGKKH